MATYKDLQQRTGLSLATISKHFTGGTVLPENRAAIERAAAELDYRPNGLASGLRSKRSRTVGVLLPALANEFHLTVIAGVEGALRADGTSVIVASSPDAEADAVALLLGRRVDGIVAVPSPHDVAALARAAQEVPVVQLDWSADVGGTDVVELDNRAGGMLAARHLLEHGHTRIGVIGGDPAISSTRERTAGAVEALAEAGHPVSPDLIRTGPLEVEQGAAAMHALLGTDRRPTAVLAVNRELTLGAVTAAHDAGLRLGDELSLVGFDGLDLAAAMSPRLTVVAQPMEALALRAAERIRARIAASNPLPPARIVLPATLVEGGSVRRITPEPRG